MTLDIRGSLKNTKISANRYVVFEEMISNSIDAFLIRQDESPSDIDLRIKIAVRLFGTDLMGEELDVAVSCTDNGCGLGEKQIDAFLTKDTSYNRLRMAGWTRFATGKGYFRSDPLPDPEHGRNLGELYAEILFFEDLVDRARKRIGVYKDRLKIELS
jgi:hypothetical protein